MPEYLSPGVYVEEISTGPKPIEGVSTSTTGFAGRTERGPTTPRLVTSLLDYQRWFGSYIEPSKSFLPYAVRGFFENGGKRAFIARVVGAGAKKASRILEAKTNDPEGGGTNVLVATAIGPGDWGNNLLIRIVDGTRADPDAPSPSPLFRITILYYKDGIPSPFVDPTNYANLASPFFQEPTAREDFDNLSAVEGSANYVVTTVNAGSRLVHLDWGNLNPKPGIVAAPARPENVGFGITAAAELDSPTAGAKLALSASGPGTWGDGITVTSESGEEGNVLIVQWTTMRELFDDLSPDPESPNYILDVVNSNSRLVRLDWKLNVEEDVAKAEAKVADAEEQLTAAREAAAAATGDEVEAAQKAVTDAEKKLAKAHKDLDKAKEAAVKAAETPPELPGAASVELEGGEDTPFHTDSKEQDPTPGDFAGKGTVPPSQRTGLAGLETIDEISLLMAPDDVNPGIRNGFQITNSVLDQCERLKDRFAILSVRKGQGTVQTIYPVRDTSYGAIYSPWIRIFDPRTQDTLLIPPTGHVAGIYARTDIERGVHKAPANEVVRGIITRDLNAQRGPLEFKFGKGEQDILNPRGVDVIRDFRSDRRGIRVWGARTMSSDGEWKYVNVRRLFIFIEESIDEGTQWVVFEPNDDTTWTRVVRSVTNFLNRVWRDGALMESPRKRRSSSNATARP